MLGLGALVVLLVVAGFAAFAFLGVGGDEGTRATAPSASDSDSPSPEEDVLEDESGTDEGDADDEGGAVFLDPIRPDSLDSDGTSVWVSDAACGVVVQIDKATEEVVGSVTVGESASGVAVAAGSVWVGTRSDQRVVRIDPSLLEVSGFVVVPGSPLGLSSQGNEVWATDPVLGVVYRIDAAEGRLLETIEVGFNPHNVEVGNGTAWVTNQAEDTVNMIDTGSNRTTAVLPVGGSPLHAAIGAGSVWITDSNDGAVRRLNERTGELEAVIEVGRFPHGLSFANGSVWVGTETGSFWRIDPSNNSATRIEDADFTAIDTTVDGTDVWVADSNGGSVVRFDTSTGTVASTIDLNEFGDCQAFRSGQLELPSDPPRGPSL